MTDPHSEAALPSGNEKQQSSTNPPNVPGKTRKKKSKSMHDGIAVWCDCCSCEAEPYWAELAEEMGIDLGSDYEDERDESRDGDL